MLLSHIFLTLPIDVYPAKKARKNFVTTKCWQIFQLIHPMLMGGGAEAIFNQITFISSKE